MGIKYLLKLRNAFCLMVLLLASTIGEAKLIGAELNYSVNNDSIQLILTTFDDYSEDLSVSKYIEIKSKNSSTKLTAELSQKSQYDITPICSRTCTNYTWRYCRNPKTLVKTTYFSNISLAEFTSTDCELTLTWSSCCRPNSDEDYFIQSQVNVCIEGKNSSPQIINEPYPILSYNEAYSYSFKAKDAEGDSLVYELITAKSSETETYEYEKGLDYKTPFYYLGYPHSTESFPKGFHFSSDNGLLRFQPTKASKAPITVKISEFRGGVKIGETIRETHFSIQNMGNSKPVVTGINGGFNESITACLGQKVCFTLQTEDNDINDIVDLNWTSDIPNASINKTTGRRPSIQFCWTPGKNDIRAKSYFISVIASDNSCEYTGKYERIIEVKVVSPFDVSFSSKISACQEADFNAITTAKNQNKLKFEWRIDGQSFYGENISVPFKTSGIHDAKLIVTNEITGCYNDFKGQVTIPEKPILSTSKHVIVCPNTETTLSASGTLSYEWTDSDNNVLGNKSKIDFSANESTEIKVKGTDKYGCEAYDTVKIDVREIEIYAFADETIVCKGNTITISALGSENFIWSAKGLKSQTNSSATYALLKNETIIVSGVDKNGCFGNYEIEAEIDQDCVWPGDINGDEEVNNHDVLRLAVSYNEEFQSNNRKPKTPSWTPYISENWPKSFSDNRNYKHADINGDGLIDFNDLLVIDKFYTKQVSYTDKKGDYDGVKLYFDYNIDSLKGKKYVEIDVYLGTKDKPAKDVYGIAFTIDYNKIVDTSSISFSTDDSWLAEGSSTIKLVKNIPNKSTDGGGKIDIAFSRTNKSTKSGSGKVGSVKFVVDDNLDWKRNFIIELILESIELIDVEGKELESYGESTNISLAQLFSSVNYSNLSFGINAYPNPVTNQILNVSISEVHQNCTLKIVSTTGQEILINKNVSAGQHQITLPQIQGYYLLFVESEQGNATLPIIIK